MKKLLVLLILLLPTLALANTDEYDSRYCNDPVELQEWQNIINNNPDSDAIAALHALWIGLCVKVEAHNLTTIRANAIFENFRSALINQAEQHNKTAKEKEKT